MDFKRDYGIGEGSHGADIGGSGEGSDDVSSAGEGSEVIEESESIKMSKRKKYAR